MSDFDKEAERERLREKYEQEQEEREATEKMSELLLQGATMTNAHCSECGDPIFRYDGQEFCATCEKAVDRDTGDEEAADDGAGDEPDPDGTAEEGEHIEVTSPDDGAQVKFGADTAAEAQAATGADQRPTDQRPTDQQPTSQQQTSQQSTDQQSISQHQTSQQSTDQQPTSQHQTSQQPTDTQQQPRAESQSGQPQNHSQTQRRSEPAAEPSRDVRSVDPSAPGDVTAARESLVRTLTRFSRQAEATEDPQRAREYLAAAREAADALSALRN